MKKAKKILTLVCCAVLLVCLSVGATLAYLTAHDEVKNTFTVGEVEIKLDEAKVNEDGTIVEGADRVKANDYHLMPNHEYVKDPTVTVIKDSEESYVRMLVTVSTMDALKNAFPANKYPTYYNGDLFLLQMLVTGWDANTWLFEGVTETGAYEFRYKTTVAKNATQDTVLEPLFKTVMIPGTVTNTELAYLDGVTIDVVAQAIQADGFANAGAAWAAWGN